MSGIDNSYKMDGDVLLVISLFQPSTAADLLLAPLGREAKAEPEKLRLSGCTFEIIRCSFAAIPVDRHKHTHTYLYHSESRNDPLCTKKSFNMDIYSNWWF